MKTCTLLLIIIACSLDCFPQLGNSTGPSFKIMLLGDSGEKVEVTGSLTPDTPGKLLVVMDSNDIRKEIYDKQLQLEVIHVRGSSPLTVITLTGLKDFENNDVLKTLRPALRSGDRIVVTSKMLSDPEPSAQIINIR